MTAKLIQLQPHLDRKRAREVLRRKLEGGGNQDMVADYAKMFMDNVQVEAMRRLKAMMTSDQAEGRKGEREPAHAMDAAAYTMPPAGMVPPEPKHFYGSKYDADLSIDEIIKRLRADILDTKKKKGSPMAGARITVRKRSVTHYWGITITVRTFAENPINPAYVKLLGPRCDYNNLFDLSPGDRPDKYTRRARQAIIQLEALAKAYNHDRSDSQTDYFDVRFYLDVDFDSGFEHNAEDALRKEMFPHE